MFLKKCRSHTYGKLLDSHLDDTCSYIVTEFVHRNEQTEYKLFYALDDMGTFDTASPTYKTDFERNYVILTMGYKF